MLSVSEIGFDFSGRTVAVCGSAGTFGRWISEAFGRAGARLALIDRTAQSVDDGADGHRAYICDLTDETAVAAAVDRIESDFGDVHVLVNCVGMFPAAPLLDVPVDLWDRIFDANTKSILLSNRSFARHMIRRKIAGSLINLTSNSAGVIKPGNIPYCASKAAAHSPSVGFALELAEFGIRVNSIEPGYGPAPGTSSEIVERVRDAMPLKAIGGRFDTAAAVMFLASEAARLITGAYINVDGGWPLTPAAVDPGFLGISGVRPEWSEA